MKEVSTKVWWLPMDRLRSRAGPLMLHRRDRWSREHPSKTGVERTATSYVPGWDLGPTPFPYRLNVHPPTVGIT